MEPTARGSVLRHPDFKMFSEHKFITIIFLLYGVRLASGDCNNVTQLSTQLDLLLAEYERAAPPAAPADVAAALEVRHATVNERDATVRLLGTMYLSWEDKRLSWNASGWGCDSTLVSAERLWRPEVRVLSAATAGVDGGAGPRARLTSTGLVSWPVPVDLLAPLTLTLRDWPNDNQQIVFKFGSQSHTVEELKLTVSKKERSTVFESGTWELMSIQSAEASWRRLDSEHSILSWTLRLRRRAAAHSLSASAILATAVLLLVGAALLPPETRAPLCAIAALTVSLCLPRLGSASSAPLVMSLFCVVSCVSSLAAGGAALVLRVSRCSAAPPPALRKLLTTASTFCNLGPSESSGAEYSAWAAAAQLLDYGLLTSFGLTLIVVVCLYL
ncbi:neurotransmitter gated ion channel [Danaus plexippus plexippus]|uniref:Neurotransmitter gated ion channel n=1 Tax=Danaus plexippus plexippus TaxID=278856 RepID=A0A212F671_DANPL|nr:neurotransmitter gated ion channel [Danaus plexippus plexippus]